VRAHVFAERGPAFRQVVAAGPIDWDLWDAGARHLYAALAGGADLDRRIHHLYLPVWAFLIQVRRASPDRAVTVGLQAPQGAGKTTLVTHLLDLLPLAGLRGAAVSIDDFYLTHAEQRALAAAHPGNPYLEHRGYPGTHDVALGRRTLESLRSLGGSDGDLRGPVRVPVYDKSAHAGRGDRVPDDHWRDIRGPLDVVMLEGWMLGFEPVDEAGISDPSLRVVNDFLAGYRAWTECLDAFVVLRALEPTYVVDWRVEAEANAAAAGKPALDREAILDYVRRFLPAYEMYAGRPPSPVPGPTISIALDSMRRPVADAK
jgi:D-glycerate 3-kinase